MSSEASRGLVENKARQRIARALMRSGPLTARGVVRDTGLSIAGSRYHLRVLATVGAVAPFLKGVSKGDEVAYALTPEKLPAWAREVLLGEVSLRTYFELVGILFFEDRHDVTELAVRLSISRAEVDRYIQTLRMKGWAKGTRRFDAGDNRADRISDYDPEWFEGWFERPGEGGDGTGPREDDAE